MCLDHPFSYDDKTTNAKKALEDTHRWAEESVKVHPGNGRLLFGIMQGGFSEEQRIESSKYLSSLDFDGLAIGGLSLGEDKESMISLTTASLTYVPKNTPRYFMGLGTMPELLELVAIGVDMFDCVIPTRLARHGIAITRRGNLNMRNSLFMEDFAPIDQSCECQTCKCFSRAYLRHLYLANELLVYSLLSVHNIYTLVRFMQDMRQSILDKSFAKFKEDFYVKLFDK